MWVSLSEFEASLLYSVSSSQGYIVRPSLKQKEKEYTTKPSQMMLSQRFQKEGGPLTAFILTENPMLAFLLVYPHEVRWEGGEKGKRVRSSYL